jgi:hypothetical protein
MKKNKTQRQTTASNILKIPAATELGIGKVREKTNPTKATTTKAMQ